MSPRSHATAGDLAVMLGDALERERRLGRAYREEMQTTWSPRVRRLWEQGWAVKRAHEEALSRILGSVGEAATENASTAESIPSSREILSWLYDQERFLAGRYWECVGRAPDASTQTVLRRLAEEQRRLVQRLRETYRDFSAA